MITKILLAGAFVFLAACQGDFLNGQSGSSGDEPPNEKLKTPAVGWINGKEWRFAGGRAKIQHFVNQDYLVIDLWSKEFAKPCGEALASPLQIHLKVIASEGSWTIGLDPFKTQPIIIFTDGEAAENILGNVGSVRITALGSQVVGYFEGLFDNPARPQTAAEGSFSVPLCP